MVNHDGVCGNEIKWIILIVIDRLIVNKAFCISLDIDIYFVHLKSLSSHLWSSNTKYMYSPYYIIIIIFSGLDLY